MSIWSRINRIWSGLDWRDKEENKRQQQQFDKNDEEERRRRREQAAAVQAPQQQNAPQEQQEKPELGQKVGSQSNAIPAYKNIFEQLGDKLEANSPQDKAKRLAQGGPEEYQGSKFGEKGISFKDAEKEIIKMGRGIARTPEKLVRSADQNTRLENIEDINAVLGGKKDSVEIYDATKNNSGFWSKLLSNKRQTYTANDKDELTKIRENLQQQHSAAAPQYTTGPKRVLYGDEPIKTVQEESKDEAENIRQGKSLYDMVPDWLPFGKDLKKWARENPESAGRAQVGAFTAADVLGAAEADQLVKGGIKAVAERGADDVVEQGADDLIRAGRDATEEATSESATIMGTTKKTAEAADEGIEVAPGVKSTNLRKVAEEEADDLGRRVDLSSVNDDLGRTVDLTDLNAPTALPRAAQNSEQIVNPTMLTRADEAAQAADDVPIADWGEAINAPLERPITPEVADDVVQSLDEMAPAVQQPQTVDAMGNPVLTSDAQNAAQLADEGIVPMRGESPAGTAEASLQRGADEALREQVQLTEFEQTALNYPSAEEFVAAMRGSGNDMSQIPFAGNEDALAGFYNEAVAKAQSGAQAANSAADLAGAAAPQTRTRAAQMLSDEQLQSDVLENFPQAQSMNIAETDNLAKAAINDMTDDELIASFANTSLVETPEDFFRAVNSIRRLEQIGSEEAEIAIKNAIDGLSEYSARSGRNLRTTQILFEDMPSTMKVDYLMKKLSNAGAEMSEADRATLATLVQNSDEATIAVKNLEDEARKLIENGTINNQGITDQIRERVAQLASDIQAATREKEVRSGQAWQFYQDSMPKNELGKRFGDMGRTLMLSSPTGRVFDLASTGITATDDVFTKNASNLLGKVYNRVAGAGKVQDTFTSPSQLIKGGAEGARRTAGAFRGDEFVEDFLAQARQASRGQISGGGKVRQFIRGTVEAPTNLSMGLKTDQLFREGMQEAASVGLKGEARQLYAELRSVIPDEQQLRTASEYWKKANMLQDNKISRLLTNMANSLDSGAGGWGSALIRNQVAPFTSWLGGNIHRTLTDKNVLFNAYKIAEQAVKGNPQGVIDNLARLGVNTAEAYALGTVLTQAGIITTTDANGDDYGGLYFHIGDRYIPVAIAGTMSVPLILGNAAQQSMDANEEGKDPVGTFANALTFNTLKNAGVASVFGGDNNLQNTISSLVQGDQNAIDTAAQYAGNLVRQYIPGLTGDINAFLDNYTPLNPSKEAPETKVTKENPETGREKTDIIPTEINRTLARIPFASQGLDRRADTAAKDPLDRALKSTRETGAQVETRQTEKSEKDAEKDRKARNIPESQEGINARMEDGEYDKAVEGYRYLIDKKAKDGELSKSKRQEYESEIKRLEITRDGKYDPEVINLYKDTSLTEWREMGDPDSEEYDPETYALLMEYDGKMTDAGVSRGKKFEKHKYYDKNSGSGRGGRGGKKGKGIGTSIGKQDFNGGKFQPFKAQQASNELRKSPIPTITPVPNNDRSKRKKISVTKGGRT